ncbi:hypothetical protein [Psychroserpens sp.]|uniref:hypothetical protein n=1 Tax=Psychroserpens sp. TaxID=2020870 RepID=UPI002B266490|nr:hypothetical protein [Psychroserpens sp.]
MKSKTKTYLLLIGVLLIWGIIAYKIIIGINPDEPVLIQQNSNVAFNPIASQEIDTFSIQNVNRDPFLGTLSSRKKHNNQITKSVHKNSTENQLEIIYKGLIQKQNTSDQVFVIHIENTEHLLKTGQTIDKIKLVSGNQKSIKIFYNNTYQTIERQ